MALAQSTLGHLAADPTAPIPASASKRDRQRIGELREAYRAAMGARAQRRVLTDPAAIADLMGPLCGALRVERFYVLPLDSRSQLIGEPILASQGDVDGTEAGVRLVLREALIVGAATFAIVHNHPSGDPSPSLGDIAVTKRIVAGGRAIDCQLVDHVIIGAAGQHYSIRRHRPDCWA